MGCSINTDVDVEDRTGSNPAAKGDSNGASGWYGGGEA